MLYNELPESINSPITGDELELMPIDSPNDNILSVANFLDDCTECFDPYIARYTNKTTFENIYVTIKIINTEL